MPNRSENTTASAVMTTVAMMDGHRSPDDSAVP